MNESINLVDQSYSTVFGEKSTGTYKITIRGDYLGNKWNRRRKGWMKLHVIVDINEIRAFTFL